MCIDGWINRFKDERVDMIAAAPGIAEEFWLFAKAELTDQVYAIIKKYQHETN